MITENLSTLKIHKLTQAQYDRELTNGTLDPNALYLTPDEEIDLSGYATVEQLNTKADAEHNHDDRYYTELEVDDKFSEVNISISNIINRLESDPVIVLADIGLVAPVVDENNAVYTDENGNIFSL